MNTEVAPPNTRVQRTRSSASPPRSPLTRYPLGAPLKATALSIAFMALLVLQGSMLGEDPADLRLEVTSGLVPNPFDPHAKPTPETSRTLVVECLRSVCRSGGRLVSTEAVAALVSALQAQPVPAVRLVDLGITQPWLDAQASAELGRVEADFHRTYITPKAKTEFGAHLRDLAYVGSLIESYYRGGWTDDYPGVKGKLSLAGGREIEFSSEAQQAYMIPWRVGGKGDPWVSYPDLETRGGSQTTYNVAIGRSLAALCPPGFENGTRMSGEALATWLLQEVWKGVGAR